MASVQTLPPGPKGLPFAGNTFQFLRDPLGYFRKLERTYGRMATIHIGKRPIILCFRPEHVGYFLTEQQRNFTKPRLQTGLKRFLGDGLLTSEGEFHRQQRRLVQPAFHKRHVESYAGVMVKLTEEMLAGWQPQSEVNIASEMQQLTLRIIAKTLFNIDASDQVAEIGQAFTDVIEVSARPFGLQPGPRIPLPFLPREKKLRKSAEGLHTIDAFVYSLIAQRRRERQDVGDVLSMLLDAQDEGNSMTDKQVHDQVLTFVAAGHETAQNTLSWTFYLLSRHQEVREKSVAELQTVLGGRAPTVEDLPNLPYLSWVLNESWRFYPPAWTQARQSIEAFDLDGYHFPAGTVVMISQWVVHNLADIWGDPEVFRPERWDPARNEKIPQWAYFPFGGGPRICIGMPFAEMETKLLLATILQKYTPRLVPGFPVVLQPRVTLRPKYGVRMILEPTRVTVSI